MEYRIRRHDGEYRWVLDNGNPHYGDDGTFHGHVGGCIDITDRREAEQSLRDLSRKLIVAQEEERRRIARELHDHLSQRLALLAIELQQLGTNPPAGHDALVAAIQDLWHRTTEISSDVHSISHRLHPSRLEALGLVITIHGHCRDVSRRGVRVHFSERNVPSDVPPDVALCLFRILEEAVTNAIQHGGATDVSVTLARVDQELVLRIEDTGRGFDPAGKVPTLGLGLVSMRERLHSLGGTLTVASAPGHGALIEARVRCAMAAIGAPIEDSSPADIRIRAAGRDRLPRPLSFSADD
jgi:signal transduction histidine kinase